MCQIEAVVSIARDIVVPAAVVVVAHRFFIVKVHLVLKNLPALKRHAKAKGGNKKAYYRHLRLLCSFQYE
jgi:hypothetical protein